MSVSKRVFVKVTADFDVSGKIRPLSITWSDGRQFEIDRVLDVRPGIARSGGSGIRYLCRILGHEVPLYYDELAQRWWCDGKGDA
jgi:hypothetical protein